MKETDLAEIVIWWLREFKWEVYQEVQYMDQGPVVDIVATRGRLLRVIECKLSFSAALVEQAWRHKPFAHWVHIATPVLRQTKGRRVLEQACIHLGIGHLEASESRYGSWKGQEERIERVDRKVIEMQPAPLNRKAFIEQIRKKLSDKHKTYAPAGNSEGLRYTPWKGTCDRWAEYVRRNPGCTLKEIVSNEKHHYASDTSARCNMVKWIKLGKIPGIEIQREGRLVRLYPANEVA